MLITTLTKGSSSSSSTIVKNESLVMPVLGQHDRIKRLWTWLLRTQFAQLLGEIVGLVSVVQDADVVVDDKLLLPETEL